MNEHHTEPHGPIGARTVRTHQFVVMIALVLAMSLFLVYVALSLYQSSGTLQLDLSRPGYDNARQEAIKGDSVFKGYAADGPINAASLKEFDELYKQKAAEALIEIDAFSGDALTDATLTLDRD
jgi:ABC-type Na+ efflux pump permease subunit